MQIERLSLDRMWTWWCRSRWLHLTVLFLSRSRSSDGFGSGRWGRSGSKLVRSQERQLMRRWRMKGDGDVYSRKAHDSPIGNASPWSKSKWRLKDPSRTNRVESGWWRKVIFMVVVSLAAASRVMRGKRASGHVKTDEMSEKVIVQSVQVIHVNQGWIERSWSWSWSWSEGLDWWRKHGKQAREPDDVSSPISTSQFNAAQKKWRKSKKETDLITNCEEWSDSLPYVQDILLKVVWYRNLLLAKWCNTHIDARSRCRCGLIEERQRRPDKPMYYDKADFESIQRRWMYEVDIGGFRWEEPD